MTNILVVSVAVENTVYNFDKLFDYTVPQNLCVAVGQRVMVPFGRSNKKYQAMVMSVKNSVENTQKLKQIFSVLDSKPLLTEEMLSIAVFMKERYYCTIYDAIRAMLPAGINYKITPSYSAVPDFKDLLNDLTQEEQRTVLYISKCKQPVKESTLNDVMGFSKENTIAKNLVKKGVLLVTDDAIRKIKDASVKMVRSVGVSDGCKLTPKQNSVLELLHTVGSVSVKEICYYTGVTAGVIDALVKKNLAEYYEAESFRNPIKEIPRENKENIVLSPQQQQAYTSLLEKYNENIPNVALLYGVTGSGKTSVFMKLIDTAYTQNKGVIVMVPEIALTPQLINIFRARYGEDVAVFHSGLSMGERLDEWKRVRRGIAKIAIGTRSAVFAPFSNLGLIIMDEEQEYTYKSECTPRYHAREVAKLRCTQNKCLLLLSSATPSVESFYFAKNGRYSLNTITQRYGGARLPKVIVADMNTELAQGNNTGFSSPLMEALDENLSTGMQSILLLNRRGHNTIVSCRTCNEVITCPNCSISLTYHSANNRLMCHYCGYSMDITDECPACHNKGLKFAGAGTQKAEQTLAQLVPNARILRLDTDATMSKYSHEKKLKQFADGEYDILVGTQMVAKGLNFPNVTLVGVLTADQMLYSEDYRSYERTFSLLTQVVGRSGRGKHIGRAIIQTFTPENPVILLASQQNYDEFYKSEILARKGMLYPPFADIGMIGFVGENELKTINAARAFTLLLTQTASSSYSDLPLRVLGPSPAAVSKVNNKFRYKIILKFRNNIRFREMLSSLLVKFGKNNAYSDVTVYVDINPDSII